MRFAGQTDLVIWDAATKTEHFVREAYFESGEDLGFLAPVPSVPTFAEADPEAFEIVRRLTEPPVDANMATASAAPEGTMKGVDVLRRENVAGYDAVVLKAGDAGALRAWLQSNGFPAPAWVEGWAAPYLAKKWPIAAFRILRGEAQRPVRMTFRTEVPFAPYAVPKENGARGSHLRLYVVSVDRLSGKVGDTAWKGQNVGSAPLPDDRRADLARALRLSPEAIPAGATATRYDDREFGTEPTHDLTFEATNESGVGSTLATGLGIAIVSFGLGRVFQKRRS